MYQHLRSMGYFVEVLGAPLTCFDASQYGKKTQRQNYESSTAAGAKWVLLACGIAKENKIMGCLLLCPCRHIANGGQ